MAASQTEGGAQVFAFVNTYDTKSKRRLYEVLKSQGLQMNQQVVFLSDGGDTVRDLQAYLSPESEHLLDWFHVTMRLTVMGQMIKGMATELKPHEKHPEMATALGYLEKHLASVKWNLWHFLSMVSRNDAGRASTAQGGGIEVPAPGLFRSR